jgi:hypothetical protein
MSMVLLRRISITLGLALAIGAAGGVFLARIGAGHGWYYALGILLAALVVLRTLAPTVGMSAPRLGGSSPNQPGVKVPV